MYLYKGQSSYFISLKMHAANRTVYQLWKQKNIGNLSENISKTDKE